MDFQLHRRMLLSWLVIAATLILMLTVGTLAFKVNAAPLVANLSTSTLAVDKSVARNGEALAYTLTINNSGDTTASNITVTNTLPSDLSYNAGSLSVSSTEAVITDSIVITGNNIVWKGIIGSGKQLVISISSANIPNSVSIGTVLTDTVAIDHTSGSTMLNAETTIVAAAPDMSDSTKSANKTVAKIGDTINYTIMLDNSGDATGIVVMTDTLPAQLTYVASSLSVSYNGGVIPESVGVSSNVVSWKGQIGQGAEATINFAATVNTGVADGVIINNSAQIEDGTSIITRIASTTVVSQTEVLIYLPVVFKVIPAPVVQIGSVSESGSNASWTVSWNNVLPTSGEIYEIQEATDAGFTQNIATATTTSLSKQFTHLAKSGLTYYYRVRVTSSTGSAYSAVKSVTLESDLKADSLNINGDNRCTTLRWDFQNISSIHLNLAKGFNPRGVNGKGSMRVCPSRTTTYRADIVYPNGSVVHPSITINVTGFTGSECNRDPYIERFDSTAYDVPKNTDITLHWKVKCASEVHLRIGGSSAPLIGVNGEGKYEDFRMTGDTDMNLIVKSKSQAHGDFNETSTFTVTVNNREVTSRE